MKVRRGRGVYGRGKQEGDNEEGEEDIGTEVGGKRGGEIGGSDLKWKEKVSSWNFL